MKFTKTNIDKLPVKEKPYFVWDAALPGFGVKIFESGRKSYVYQYRLGGKGGRTRRMTIGRHGSITVEQAKKEAKKNAGIVAQGIDAFAEKKAEIEERENRYTFVQLWQLYKGAKPELKGIRTDENRFQKHLQPVFGRKTPSELSPIAVDRFRQRLLNELAPGTVRNVLELLRRLANFAVNKQLCDPLSFKIELPTVNNLKTEDLTAKELKRLWNILDQEDNLLVANFMKMVLFTGMRRGELFKLQWEHIDFERGFISLVNPKGKIDQHIPLNQAARKILIGHVRTESPFVFPGRGGKQRVCIKKQVNRIKEAAELPKDFRAVHGLRHVYASSLASSGKVDLYTLQKLLTHKSSSMTERYAHLRDEALQKAAQVASELMCLPSKDEGLL
jgi:integrase